MKSSKLAAILTAGLTAASTSPILAVTFGQTEVNQSKFIAIAVPRSSNYFGLTVLEQVSNQRPCWRESGQSPTLVDPLLLGFSFSGICSRNADSNGYSIRHRGRDLGLEYRLTLQRSGNDVVLLGMPSSSREAPMVIGRTRGLSNSLMKIDLEPGWKFTKRNYQGKTLGHVYLTHEGSLPMGGTTKSLFSRSPVMPPSQASPPAIAKVNRPGRIYRLYVRPASSSQERLVKSLVPGSFRSSYRGRSVMQAGLFNDRSKARSLEKSLNRRGLRTTLVEEQGVIPISKAPAPPSATLGVPSGSLLRVPSSQAPLGNARGEGDVYGRGTTLTPPPPPNPTLALAKRYRVLVRTSSSRQQAQIRSIVGDAFRSSYRGQPAMQVGSYTSMAEAQGVIQLMQRNGFQTVID